MRRCRLGVEENGLLFFGVVSPMGKCVSVCLYLGQKAQSLYFLLAWVLGGVFLELEDASGPN